MNNDYILEMNHITKEFPGVKALDDVSIKVRRGEIHALCGENGAGKSTLIKVLSAVYPGNTYSGELIFDGKARVFKSIREAERLGIVCIHQELSLVPELSVGENIFLGAQPSRSGVIDQNRLYSDSIELLKRVGLLNENHEGVLPDEKIKNLTTGKQQLVEIAKALSKNARLLILDEPTSSLTEREVDILLTIIDQLRKDGISCIYISHKLDEVKRIADTVTVLRDGKSIKSGSVKEMGLDEIIQHMVGREMSQLFPREEHHRGDCIMEVRNYNVENPYVPGKNVISDISFKVYKGEILGISGLIGAGRTELFSSLFGAYPGKASGEVFIDGKQCDIKSPIDAIKAGFVMATEDRKNTALVLGMSVLENTTLSSLDKVSNRGVLNQSAEIHEANRYKEYLRIKTPDVMTKVVNLSGGNQQKVVLSKVLLTDPKILVVDEPTRGIDVGAKYEIYKILNELVDRGVAVIMISSEMEEIMGMSDRILVISGGKLRLDMDYSEITQEKIMESSAIQ